MTGLSARIWLMLLLWVIICQSGVFADSFTGKCIEVVDGDTIVVVCDGKEKKIRIEGIDCPEKGQDFYDEAKQLTSDLVLNEDVWVNVRKIDSYGRSVSCVEVCNKDLRVELLNAGLAMHYTKHNKEKLLEQTENEARGAKRGIWSLNDVIAPWDFRQREYNARHSQAVTNAMIDTELACIKENEMSYHRPECEEVAENSSFALRAEVKKAGLLPCPKCRPDYQFKKKAEDYGFFEAHNPKAGVAPVGASLEATDVVYITETGSSYHREDCGYLQYSSIKIPRTDANASGYKPCRICRP